MNKQGAVEKGKTLFLLPQRSFTIYQTACPTNLFVVTINVLQRCSRSLIEKTNNARVAELVDALVSNTSDSNIVSVRPRSRVQLFLLTSWQLMFYNDPFKTAHCIVNSYQRLKSES